jgi:hypothetical protein
MNKIKLLLMATILSVVACTKKDDQIITSDVSINKTLKGLVQKGPYLNGSSILVSELNSDLTQTGRTYSSQILSNNGSFQVSNINLRTPYVALRADGYYFNEVIGESSASQLTLYALSDTSRFSNLNVNLITSLIRLRVEYIVSQGAEINIAKKQAEREVLAIFNITKNDFQTSESLDISATGEDNAILLAISCILQGYRTESELTELISDISLDIKNDGFLNDTLVGNSLINHAIYLDTNKIKTNLQNRYSNIGSNYSIPQFGKYIRQFIENTTYHVTSSIFNFQSNGFYGPNILNLNQINYSIGTVSLSAILPKSTTLKILIKSNSSSVWYFQANSSWSSTTFDFINHSQVFTAINSFSNCDLSMNFDPGSYTITYYENNMNTPTRVKNIIVN